MILSILIIHKHLKWLGKSSKIHVLYLETRTATKYGIKYNEQKIRSAGLYRYEYRSTCNIVDL